MPMPRMDDWIAFHEGTGQPPFGVGDVIGCGVDLATCQIFYTSIDSGWSHTQQTFSDTESLMETAGLFVDSAADLFPCISLSCVSFSGLGTKVDAPFGNVYIGLGTNKMPLDRCVGWCKGTYAYGSHGHFLDHAVDGCSREDGHPRIKGKCKFGGGDVIGCGVDLATRQIIYAKNGRQTTGLFVIRC
uniref:B30.2/SPRY domain-containing protein n=1 Tax=Globodera rostochiensis TaxID=31243 RepID=A0A914H7E5_GLORO